MKKETYKTFYIAMSLLTAAIAIGITGYMVIEGFSFTESLFMTIINISTDLKIISRASDEHSDKKLKRAGASNVIMPDRVGGQRMAKLVIQPDIVEFVEYIMLQGPDTGAIEEVSREDLAGCYDGKTIRELDPRNESGANILGLRKKDKTYVINPSPDETLTRDDKKFALGNASQIKRLKTLITIGKVNE